MAIIANNIPSRGMSHIYPLELSWQQPIFPPEGLLDLSSGDHTIMLSCPSRRVLYAPVQNRHNTGKSEAVVAYNTDQSLGSLGCF